MRFRKYSIMFMEHIVICCLVATVCIALIPIDPHRVLPVVSFAIFVFLAFAPVLYDEYITIDDEGIACTRRKKLLWEYRWDEIRYLKKGSRYRAPSIEIVTDNCVDGAIPYDYSQHYFQLGRTARKALKQCRIPNDKTRF